MNATVYPMVLMTANHSFELKQSQNVIVLICVEISFFLMLYDCETRAYIKL